MTCSARPTEYRTVEIDGKLFGLAHRGRDKILLGLDLEGGIYDLTAQRFGIMDVEASLFELVRPIT
jgi:hypothetical protein